MSILLVATASMYLSSKTNKLSMLRLKILFHNLSVKLSGRILIITPTSNIITNIAMLTNAFAPMVENIRNVNGSYSYVRAVVRMVYMNCVGPRTNGKTSLFAKFV